jgi:hypothetical protein
VTVQRRGPSTERARCGLPDRGAAAGVLDAHQEPVVHRRAVSK